MHLDTSARITDSSEAITFNLVGGSMVSGLKEPARISHLNWAGDVELYQLNGTGFIMIVKSGRGVLEN